MSAKIYFHASGHWYWTDRDAYFPASGIINQVINYSINKNKVAWNNLGIRDRSCRACLTLRWQPWPGSMSNILLDDVQPAPDGH